MEGPELRPVLEALLFAAAEPLTVDQLAEACEVEPALVTEGLAALAAEYDRDGRGVRVVEEAQGFIVITRPDYAPWVARLLRGRKKMRLSRPALETLAIIAYKQPVTKSEVDAIRGVDSSGVLNTLLERELVTIRGRSKALGRPLLYGTTGDFLSYFGLRDLTDLPRVEELKAIVGEREPENPEAEPEQLALPTALPPVEDPLDPSIDDPATLVFSPGEPDDGARFDEDEDRPATS
jgi:segregation and condensation protein B